MQVGSLEDIPPPPPQWLLDRMEAKYNVDHQGPNRPEGYISARQAADLKRLGLLDEMIDRVRFAKQNAPGSLSPNQMRDMYLDAIPLSRGQVP
jgi:hypothetical protein